MTNTKVLNFFSIICILFCFVVIKAEINQSSEERIVFNTQEIQKKATWSKGFILTQKGLETEQLKTGNNQNIWIQTDSFPIGLSWRPPTVASFNISFDGDISEPIFFIRYSPDKLNWSTWYETEKTKDVESYKTKISVPYSQGRYHKLMREWWKNKPIWGSDENEFCEWLIKKEPDFFKKRFHLLVIFKY